MTGKNTFLFDIAKIIGVYLREGQKRKSFYSALLPLQECRIKDCSEWPDPEFFFQGHAQIRLLNGEEGFQFL